MTEGATQSVRVSTGWNMPAPDPNAGPVSGDATPALWLGAEPAGGLTLPSAHPTAHQLYAPRGVWLDGDRLIAADTGNHRVMIWRDPTGLVDHHDADVILGQPSPEHEGPQAAGRGPANGMHLPTGVIVHDDRLIVADAWNHRVLVWDQVPRASGQAPDHVIGQPDAESVDENRGGPCAADGFYWPFGVAVIQGDLWVADTGNRRVLAFDGIPEGDQPAARVIGQPTMCDRDENGGAIGPASFRWPHDIAVAGDRVFIADAGNHRLLGWDATPEPSRPADMLFGQPDFETAVEIPYAPQSASTLRFPYAIGTDGDRMAVADTANNRVLVWDSVPAEGQTPADRVLGQLDFASIGENRWDAVSHDTLCWPYGLCLHRNRLAVADSGNNRIVVWDLA